MNLNYIEGSLQAPAQDQENGIPRHRKLLFLRPLPARSVPLVCAAGVTDLPRALPYSQLVPAGSLVVPRNTTLRDGISNPFNMDEARAPSLSTRRDRLPPLLPRPNNDIVSLCL